MPPPTGLGGNPPKENTDRAGHSVEQTVSPFRHSRTHVYSIEKAFLVQHQFGLFTQNLESRHDIPTAKVSML